MRTPISSGKGRCFGTVGCGLALLIFVSLISGCGGSSQMSQFHGTTQVMLLATSTGSDEPFVFNIGSVSMSLQGESGEPVMVFDYPDCAGGVFATGPCLHLAFMGFNGGSSPPLLTVTIAQGIYTSATLTVNSCALELVGAGTLSLSTDSCGQGNGEVTVNFPAPITISGSSMALLLNLQVQQSYTLSGSGCAPGGNQNQCNFTISPVFTLTPFEIAAMPTNSQNGLVTEILAQVQSVSATGFTADSFYAGSLTFGTDAATVFQGASGLSSLTASEFVELDAAIQPSGSLLATRVEADDPTALYMEDGVAATGINTVLPSFDLAPAGGSIGTPMGFAEFTVTSDTAYKISGEFTNLSSLPFPATFNAQTMIGGQHVAALFSVSILASGYPHGPPVTTITLLPQVINGTVASISGSNGFTVYDVTLSSDDLIPSVQSVAGPDNNHLSDSTSVVVYASPDTQMLASSLPSVGSVERFRGLLFDDNGTLRMDCGQILDGASAPTTN
jgi:hypothetical protein